MKSSSFSLRFSFCQEPGEDTWSWNKRSFLEKSRFSPRRVFRLLLSNQKQDYHSERSHVNLPSSGYAMLLSNTPSENCSLIQFPESRFVPKKRIGPMTELINCFVFRRLWFTMQSDRPLHTIQLSMTGTYLKLK